MSESAISKVRNALSHVLKCNEPHTKLKGRSLSMISSSMMTINPDISEAHVLRGWYDSKGKEMQFNSHSGADMTGGTGTAYPFKQEDIRTLADVKGSSIGTGDSAEYFSCRATIVHIRTDSVLYYPACGQCNKKVTETNEGWLCEKCSKTSAEPEYRYDFFRLTFAHCANSSVGICCLCLSRIILAKHGCPASTISV